MTLRALEARLAGPGAPVAGVLSGTSADGIDVGIARIRAAHHESGYRLEPPELLHFGCEPSRPSSHGEGVGSVPPPPRSG